MKLDTRYQFIANKLGILMKLQIWMAEESSWGSILNAYEAPSPAPLSFAHEDLWQSPANDEVGRISSNPALNKRLYFTD